MQDLFEIHCSSSTQLPKLPKLPKADVVYWVYWVCRSNHRKHCHTQSKRCYRTFMLESEYPKNRALSKFAYNECKLNIL